MGRGQQIEEVRVAGGETFKRGRRRATSVTLRAPEPAQDFALVGDWVDLIHHRVQLFAYADSFYADDPWLEGSPEKVLALQERWEQACATGELFGLTESELQLLAQIGPWLRRTDENGTWMTAAAEDIDSYLGGSREVPGQS